MDNRSHNKKILRSPSVKRKNKTLPINQRVQLERVLGLTSSSNAGLCCDSNSGTIAYPAGCVTVLFNPRRNKQCHIFNAHKKAVTAVAFSPDGKHLVTGETGHQPAVRVWDVEEKTQVAEFHGHKFGINCVAFSPNLKEVVSVGTQHDMMINVWNWKTGVKVASNKVSSKVSALAYSEDGKCFVTVGNRHVRFWYLEDRRSKINQTVPLMGRNGILGDKKDNFFCDVVAGQGSMCGRFFVITQSGLLCEFNEKRLLDKWVELMTKTASCVTAGREHIFVGCAEGVVRVFDATSLQYVCTLPPPHTLGVEVTTATSPSHLASNRQSSNYPDTKAIAVDDDHKKVTCIYNDRSIYIWDVHDLKRVGKAWSFLYHSGCIWALEMYPQLEDHIKPALPPGSFLTASGDNTIRVWNLNTHMPENTAYKRNIYSNELLKIVYADPTLGSLCNVDYNPAGATDKTDTTYDGKNGVRSIRVSPDGAHLASGDRQGNIRIYDMEYLTEQKCVEAHESDVMCLEYSYTKEGRILATGSRDRLIHVFDVDAGYGLVQSLGDHSSAISAVRFVDREDKLRMISCGADKSILLRNAVTTPDFQFQLEHHLATKTTLYDMVIDPTQRYLATACQDRNFRLYNIQTTKEKKCYRGSAGDEGVLLRIHLDPSGTYAATSCSDKNVCILDFLTGELLATMYGHSEVITAVKFANDLKHVITVSADGCIFVWRLPQEMTGQIRLRLQELGKKLKDTDFLRCDEPLMPNPILLSSPSMNGTFQVNKSASLSFLPRSDDVLDGRLDNEDDYDDDDEDENETLNDGSSSTGISFGPGPLPSWAKAKFGDSFSKGNDSGQEHLQPKGRWAQRVDHNVEFKSQLDVTQSEEESDRRRTYAVDGGAAGPHDLRKETALLANKKLSGLGQDIGGSTGDLRSNSTSKPKTLRSSVGSAKHKDASLFRSDTALHNAGSSTSTSPKRWSGMFDMIQGNNEIDDTDELDTGSDTTEIIYPPTEADFDSFASTYKVFAVENVKKQSSKATSGNSSSTRDDVSESTDPNSLEDEDENDETLISSTPTTPSDPDKDFLNGTKEDFVRQNFEEDTFSQLPLEQFLEATDVLEQQEKDGVTERQGNGGASGSHVTTRSSFESSSPFSPRLSLSARFMSRSGPSVFKAPLSSLVPNRPDSWFNRNKMEMSRAMDETRKSLLAMSSRNDFTGSTSPEKENPPSPPTKLEELNEVEASSNTSGHISSSPPPAFGSRHKPPVNGRSSTGSNPPVNGRSSTGSNPPTSPVKPSPPAIISPAARRITQEKERRRSIKSETSSLSNDDRQNLNSVGNSPGSTGSAASGASSAAGSRRVRPTYFKPTQSSKNKTSDGVQDAVVNLKPASGPDGGVGGNASSSGTSSKVNGSSRLSGKMKKSLYASSPNLLSGLNSDEDEKEAEEERKKKINKPKVTRIKFTSTSNLRKLSDLSRSVPDVNDESSSTDGSTTGPGCVPKIRTKSSANSQGNKPSSRLYSATGRSGSNSQLHQTLTLLPQQGASNGEDVDYVGTKSTTLTQAVRKTSASEMTLDQAKSILLGKTGLRSGMTQGNLTSDSGAGTSLRSTISRDSTSSSSSASVGAVSTSPSAVASSTSAGQFDVGSMSTAQLAIAQDIEQTASSIRHQQAASRGSSFTPHQPPLHSNLEASPYDPPERDQPPKGNHHLPPKSLFSTQETWTPSHSISNSQTFQQNSSNTHVSSVNSTFVLAQDHMTSGSSSCSSSISGAQSDSTEEEGLDGSMARSVRDRIAQFQKPSSAQKSGLPEQGDRSRLSLPITPSATPALSTTSVQTRPNHPTLSITHCKSLVEEFTEKLSLIEDMVSQTQGRTDENAQQVQVILGAAIHQGKNTLTELASKTPGSPHALLSNQPSSSSPTQGPQDHTFQTKQAVFNLTKPDTYDRVKQEVLKQEVSQSPTNDVTSTLTETTKAAVFRLSSNLAKEMLKLIEDDRQSRQQSPNVDLKE